jgi:LmbE family N-acetylglucosaminyl deacetylase
VNSDNNRILIVAAHPDDDVLGCGGIMAKYSSSKDFSILFIAEGDSCRFNKHNTESEKLKKNIEARRVSAIKSLSVFGITKIKFVDLPCGRLDTIPILDINHVIEGEIKNFNPSTIITHSEDDVNNDHRIVSRSVIMATRPYMGSSIKTVMSFEVQSSSEWNLINPFKPNFFETLSKSQVNMKWRSISYYDNEVRVYPHPRSKEGVFYNAGYRGMQCGSHYAEAFRIIRGIV